ncbi:hypothetical protein GS982_20560 [Rhodococcus hoagii]|nr:hypothetical protein [Prescottella equi]NKZ84588.1 hypothetical protein [Prescottella equi]
MDKKTIKAILKEAEAQGFTLKVHTNGHISAYKDGVYAATFAGTGSDYRGAKNSLAALRRAGFTWPR